MFTCSHISPYPAQDSSCVCLCVLFIIWYYFFVDSDKGIPGFEGVLEIDEVRSACICRWLHVM